MNGNILEWQMIMDLLLFFTAAGISWGMVRLIRPFLRKRAIDLPNERSSHTTPTPRAGGIGIIAGVAVGIVIAAAIGTGKMDLPWWWVIPVCIIATMGLLDDLLKGVYTWLRLLVQVAAAVVVVYGAGSLSTFPLPKPLAFSLGWAGWVLAVLWIVGVTNIYNFLDGIDGFAGVQGVIAGLGICFIAPNFTLSAIGLLVAGSCAGFLSHNWHPARVFMGDVGSSFLGFLFASAPFLVPVPKRNLLVNAVGLFLWFFLADGVLTLSLRLFRGEKIWEAHRSHFYQRLVQANMSHATVVIGVGSAGAIIAGLAVLAYRSGSDTLEWAVSGLAVLSFLIYWAFVAWMESRVSGNVPDG